METNCFVVSQLDLFFSMFLTCAWFGYFLKYYFPPHVSFPYLVLTFNLLHILVLSLITGFIFLILSLLISFCKR